MRSITYARARLWTGIVGVGLTVLFCLVALARGWPRILLGEGTFDPLTDPWRLALLLGSVGLALLPFELVGGWWLPGRFARGTASLPTYLRRWARAQSVLLLLGLVQGTSLLLAAQWGGRPAALAMVALGALLLLGFQAPLAQRVAGLARAHPRRDAMGRSLFVLDASDSAFSGGFTGLFGAQVVPRRWFDELDVAARAALLQRRDSVRASGERARSQLAGIAWNLTGLVLASYLPGAGVTTLAELVTTSLGFTLWTFVGLLALPSPSRAATFAIDARTAEPSRGDLARALRQVDAWQDDEPERTPALERVFHPVPSLGARLRRLARPRSESSGLWNLARNSLIFAHLGLSPLPRLVHGCVGRPELWVYLPTDG